MFTAKRRNVLLTSALGLMTMALPSSFAAGFLMNPSSQTANGLYKPTLNEDYIYEYSAWDVFYAPRNHLNYPDLFAPYGGEERDGIYYPVKRSEAEFPEQPQGSYAPADPYAFWDTRNASLVQTQTGAFIIQPQTVGNIYSYSGKTKFYIDNNPDYSGTTTNRLGTVFFQFQSFGSMADFSSIRLVYNNGEEDITILASEAEYLREYGTGTGDWSGPGSYINRMAVQWDMSGLYDVNGDPISKYRIYFDSATSSMSLQAVDLYTSEYYQAAMPLSAKWVGGAGSWNDSANWEIYRNGTGEPNEGVTLPQLYGNIRFANTETAVADLTQDFTIGELIFETAHDAAIVSSNDSRLVSNTGVTTRADATGTYTIDTDWEFGEINFFEINSGTLEMNGVLSGTPGMVKTGAGTLVLANDNTFEGYLILQNGTLRLKGVNSYSGSTTLMAGSLILEQGSASLGSGTDIISFGTDAVTYENIPTPAAEIWLDGGGTFSRDLQFARGDREKRLGVMNAPDGGVYSGTINLNQGTVTNPYSGNVHFTAKESQDLLVISGSVINGDRSKTLTIDGKGTVRYTGANKTYHNSTIVDDGTLEIDHGTSATGNGHWTVNSNAAFVVNGGLSGTGNFTLHGRLSGVGTIQHAVEVREGATLSPGNSVGTLHTGSQTWHGNARYLLEFSDANGTAGTGWDYLDITGNLVVLATEGDTFVIELAALVPLIDLGIDLENDQAWKIASWTGTLDGFDPNAFRIDSTSFDSLYNGNWSVSVNNNELLLNYQAVPEPSSILLAIGAIALLWGLHRRRTAAATPS